MVIAAASDLHSMVRLVPGVCMGPVRSLMVEPATEIAQKRGSGCVAWSNFSMRARYTFSATPSPCAAAGRGLG